MDIQRIINDSIEKNVTTKYRCLDQEVVTIVVEKEIRIYYRKHASSEEWQAMKPLQGNLV